MSITVRSFAKINLGLKIGPARPDGFHELRTIYQTLAVHDVVSVNVEVGSGIEIHCSDPRVPLDETNTCYAIAQRVLAGITGREARLRTAGTAGPSTPLRSGRDDTRKGELNGTAEAAPLQSKIIIEIDKRLPVQGGLGAASSNAVATMLALERALDAKLSPQDKLRIAAEVGSDLPLFLIGGTVLGVGRGEEVYPLPELPPLDLVIVTPPVGVSTPKAFAQWDALVASPDAAAPAHDLQLTASRAAGTINEFSASVFAWLNKGYPQAGPPTSPVFGLDGVEAGPASGVPAFGGDRAETPLLDLVRAGIENDFERVVFPEYPELREVKRVLQREGALYASLSGSGSTLYGVFASAEEAQGAAERMRAAGHTAVATTTLTRAEYWKQLGASD
ncbi:MAG: 4-(cytidine 5'-diphospho)-2-C-methyl-D-erythritol kinase [Candidatus Korobacteraceae bacterium]